MSIDNLPDELLREILSQVLHVSHPKFFIWSNIRPDPPSDSVPRSHVVLVNHRFLRIGIPILYEAVRITNQDTTKYIADILSANATVGPAVRWLRLEGGYGRELELALKPMTAVESLYFSVDARARDSIAGVRRVLLKLDPLHVWLDRGSGRPNKHQPVLHPLLHHLVRRQWTRLVRPSFLWACTTDAGRGMQKSIAFEDHWDVLAEPFVVALRDAPALEELSLDEADAVHWLGLGILQTIAENPRLVRIVCRGGPAVEHTLGLFFECLQVPERISGMFVFVQAVRR